MASIFSKKDLPEPLKKEIIQRTTKAGIVWSAKRFPWIHITSLSSTCNKKNSRLKTLSSVPNNTTSISSNILLSTYEKVGASIRPVAVVTNVQVKKQGELGTTRKVTINLSAFSDEQLIELQTCYFVPGLSCRVEWGWNEDCFGNKSTGPIGLSLELPDAEIIAAMRKRASQETHYDGIQGLVTNFSYGLTKDNIWECSLEIIAAAESFGRSSVVVQNSDCANCARKYKSEDTGKEKVETKSLLYTFFKDMYDDFDKCYSVMKPRIDKILAIPNWTGEGEPVNVSCLSEWEYEGNQRLDSGEEDNSLLANVLGDVQEGFVSWPTLEALINLRAIPYSKNGEYVVGRIVSPMHTPITYHPAVFSTDPRVCIILGPQRGKTERYIAHQKGDTTEAPTPPDNESTLTLQHIHLNIVFVMSVLKSLEKDVPENMSIHNFVMTLLNRVNEVCGSLWQFELINRTDVNLKGGPCVAVIDAKSSTGSKPLEAFSLPALPEDSILREMKLDMKMTDSMKSQALYSNANQQSTKTVGGGGCGSNVFKPFGLNKAQSLNMKQKATEDPDCSCDESSNDALPELTVDEWIDDELYSHVDDSSTSGARNALINIFSKDIKKGTDTHCKGMILPFEFSFTLDGIGGFGFGQMVSCNRIPESVREGYEWQVTTVEHSITPNDWSTTVSTVCRYK